MIIGRITSAPPLALTAESDTPCILYNFALTPDPSGLSFEAMPDSAYATPARYLHELSRRLRERHPAGRITLINPLYDLDIIRFLKVVALLKTDCPAGGNYIIADATDRPLAYIFDSPATPFALSLVSTINARLDSDLISRLLGEPMQLVTAKWRLGVATRYSRFYSVANFKIYSWLTQHALAHFRSSDPSSKAITAIMPYHAGDAFFFALAATWTESYIKGVVICKDYADVIRQHAPELLIVPIDMPPLSCAGGKISEEDYFLHHIEAVLPEKNLYAYLRPSGDYNRTSFHLIDHFAFALGASPRCADDLIWSRSHPPRKIPQSPARVLLHFDAGWPMKIYPEDAQKQIIDLLLAEGCRVTVLARVDSQYAGYRSVAFHSYSGLLDLITDHDIVVGMDSFPAHLAAHSIGVPTICLFSSTRPENSNAPPSPYYAYMEKGLPCRPCHAKTRCPVYGGDKCRNFVSPEDVASKIHSMLGHLANSPLDVTPSINTLSPKLPCAPLAVQPARTVRLERLGATIFLACLNPLNHLGYIRQISREFLATWQRQGMTKTLFKATRFMLRQMLRAQRK